MVAYDPEWPARFEALRRRYQRALDEAGVRVVAIEHVGSTSVPGLAAKPVIDCDIIVRAEDVHAASAVLVSLGFTPEGELGIPRRWAFKAPEGYPQTNTYVVVEGCLSLRNHLAVRDVLRRNAALRDEYARVKLEVGAWARDIVEYGQGKTPTVRKVLAATDLTEEDIASINGNKVPDLVERSEVS